MINSRVFQNYKSRYFDIALYIIALILLKGTSVIIERILISFLYLKEKEKLTFIFKLLMLNELIKAWAMIPYTNVYQLGF